MSLNNSLFTHYTLRSLQPEPRTRDFGFKIVGDSQTYSIFVLTTVAPPGVFTGTEFFLVYVPAPPGGVFMNRQPVYCTRYSIATYRYTVSNSVSNSVSVSRCCSCSVLGGESWPWLCTRFRAQSAAVFAFTICGHAQNLIAWQAQSPQLTRLKAALVCASMAKAPPSLCHVSTSRERTAHRGTSAAMVGHRPTLR